MSSERRSTLSEAIRRQIGGMLDELHTLLPAVVTKYDAETQSVSCKPLVKHGYLDEDDTRLVESLGVVNGVPVQFLGAGGFRMTCPISDGTLVIGGNVIPATTGALHFSEASLDLWLSGTGAEVDPEIDHRFAESDGVFVPGLNPFGRPWGYAPQDHATFGADAGVLLHAYRDHLAAATAAEEELLPATQTAVRGTEFMADLAGVLNNLAVLLPALVAVATPFLTPDQVTAAAALVVGPPPSPGVGSIIAMAAKATAPAATVPGTYQSPNLLLP